MRHYIYLFHLSNVFYSLQLTSILKIRILIKERRIWYQNFDVKWSKIVFIVWNLFWTRSNILCSPRITGPTRRSFTTSHDYVEDEIAPWSMHIFAFQYHVEYNIMELVEKHEFKIMGWGEWECYNHTSMCTFRNQWQSTKL